MLNVRQLARLLGVSPRSCWRLRDRGELPPEVRFGTCVRWRKADILAWLERGCPKTGKAVTT